MARARIDAERDLLSGLSKAQKELMRKHGLPSQFAAACYDAVPAFISMDEAAAAIEKYNREWRLAK